MKLIFTKLVACLIVGLLFSITAQAQWMQMAASGGTQATYTTVAVAPNGTPYIAFNGNVTVNDVATTDKIQVRRWTGTDWVQVGNAGFSTGGAEWISLAFNAQGVPHVAYKDKGADASTTSDDQVKVARLSGDSWQNIFTSNAEGRYTSLAFDNDGVLYLAFRDHSNGSRAVVRRYSGTGTDWVAVGTETGISTAAVLFTSLAFDRNNNLYITYSEGGIPVVQRLVGTEWQPVGSASLASLTANNTDIAIGPNNIPYLLIRPTTATARVLRLNGDTWVNVGGEGFGSGATIDWMNIEVSNTNVPYVGFMEASGRTGVYTPNAAGTAWEYVGGGRASGETNASHTGFAMNRATGHMYVTHRAASAGNRDIFVWQFTPTTTSIAKDRAKATGIQAYPNPSADSFHFTTTGKFSYTVYNNAGQVMERGQGVGAGEFGSALKAGLYFVQLQTETGNQTLKLLKQ